MGTFGLWFFSVCWNYGGERSGFGVLVEGLGGLGGAVCLSGWGCMGVASLCGGLLMVFSELYETCGAGAQRSIQIQSRPIKCYFSLYQQLVGAMMIIGNIFSELFLNQGTFLDFIIVDDVIRGSAKE